MPIDPEKKAKNPDHKNYRGIKAIQSPTHPRYIEKVEQDRKMIELRKKKLSMYQIAQELGISKETVFRRLKTYTQNYELGNVAAFREFHEMILNEALTALYPKVIKGDTKSIQAMCTVLTRQSKLLGADASTTVDINPDPINKRIILSFHSNPNIQAIESVVNSDADHNDEDFEEDHGDVIDISPIDNESVED